MAALPGKGARGRPRGGGGGAPGADTSTAATDSDLEDDIWSAQQVNELSRKLGDSQAFCMPSMQRRQGHEDGAILQL